jgi:hypothetical protein
MVAAGKQFGKKCFKDPIRFCADLRFMGKQEDFTARERGLLVPDIISLWGTDHDWGCILL